MSQPKQTNPDLARAMRFFQGGDLKRAEQSARAAEKAAPAQANQILAGIALKRGDLPAAHARASAAVAAAPGAAMLLLNLATIEFALGRREEGLETFRKAAGLAPRDFEAQLSYGKALAETGRLEEALEQFQRAHRLSPHPRAKGPIADALFRMDRLKEAEEWALGALAAGLDTAELHCLIGKIRLAGRRAKEAVEAFNAALARDPRHADALMGLSCARAQMNDLLAARDATRRYLELRPVIRSGAAEPQARVAVLHGVPGGRLQRPVYGAGLPMRSNFPNLLHSELSALLHCFLPIGGALPEGAEVEADLVLNNIANPELLSAEDAAGAQAALGRFRAPVINDLPAVMRSARSALFPALGEPSGFVVPRLKAFKAMGDLRAKAAELEAEFVYPYILRPSWTNEGGQAHLVASRSEAEAALRKFGADHVYAIQYHNCRDAAGFTRMYRVTVLAGRFLPDRVNISTAWSSHGGDKRDPVFWAENGLDRVEKSFLEEPEAVTGGAMDEVFAPIHEALGLDVYGIDFGVDQDGRLILFEANAAMNLFNPKHNKVCPYRKPLVEGFYRALDELLLDRALAARRGA